MNSSKKRHSERLLVLESFELEAIGTKQLAQILTTLEVEGGLLVDAKVNEKLRLSARNLKDHDFLPPEGLNVYDLLRHQHLVVTKEAVKLPPTPAGVLMVFRVFDKLSYGQVLNATHPIKVMDLVSNP